MSSLQNPDKLLAALLPDNEKDWQLIAEQPASAPCMLRIVPHRRRGKGTGTGASAQRSCHRHDHRGLSIHSLGLGFRDVLGGLWLVLMVKGLGLSV